MLLTRLKLETREPHERLERDLDLLSDDLTLHRYKSVLAWFHAFLLAWEPRVGALLSNESFFGPRRKLPLLEADLADLGIARSPSPHVPLAFLRDRASAMGSLYVMEGSTLGGQLIARHVRDLLGLGERGTRYFRSEGRDVGPDWHAFRAVLQSFSHPSTDDAVVAGADATFRAIHVVVAGGHHSDIPTKAAAYV